MTRRLVAVVAAIVLGLIGSVVITASPGSASPNGPVVAPLSSAFSQGDDAWLVVPMGHLSDFLNTFWQLFVRTPTDDGWVTVTPPGVADNGGLVVTDGPDGGLLAGFLANQDLTFSPLSLTTDAGHTWTAVYFPQSLAKVPDAIGGSTAGVSFGLGRSGRGSLLGTGTQPSPLSSWHSVITAGRLGRSAAGIRCGVEQLTATAVASNGAPLVGASCARPGIVGLFAVGPAGVKAVTFSRSPIVADATISVLRLVPTSAGIALLLAAQERSGRTALVAGWLSDPGKTAVVSAPLPVGFGSSLLASGTTPGGGLFVLLQPPNRSSPELADIPAPGAGQPAWDVPPSPPRGTLGVAFSPGRIDAVTVHFSTLIDYVFDQSSSTWVRSQVVQVPIQYGSSS
jgi:hypothetical protein